MDPRLGASVLGTVHSSVGLATNNQILKSSGSYELVFNFSYIIRSPEEGSPGQGWQLEDAGTEVSVIWSSL